MSFFTIDLYDDVILETRYRITSMIYFTQAVGTWVVLLGFFFEIACFLLCV